MFQYIHEVENFFQIRKQYGIKPGLNRIQALLHNQGNPERYIKAVHVTGTNGKGSTIHYIKNALQANGYRIGVFTSPSMEGLTGHILDNGQAISDDLFIDQLNKLYPAIKQLDLNGDHPSEFEIITVIAFMYFSDSVDLALIETGMGGREDTTNCIQPILSIITNIGLDHTGFLGDSLEEIAYHKAGIIKEGSPAIVGNITGDSFRVIKEEATKRRAAMFKLGRDFHYTLLGKNEANQFIWKIPGGNSMTFHLSMKGKHQVENASLAIMALYTLQQLGYQLNWEEIVKALEDTVVPGRFEKIWNDPVIVIDAAHNPKGILSFLQTVSSYQDSDKEKHLIFAGFRDKDLAGMIEQCIPHFQSITLTTFEHPRAASVEEILKVKAEHGMKVEYSWEKLVKKLTDHEAPQNKVYYITGSFHFITEVREFFEKKV